MDFIEDKVGESLARIVPMSFTLIMSIGACILIIAKDEMNSGPNYAMLSGQIIAPGNSLNPFGVEKYFEKHYWKLLTFKKNVKMTTYKVIRTSCFAAEFIRCKNGRMDNEL
jgi:hypothetical protein